MKNFLNDFSKKAMAFDVDEINDYANVFDDFWKSCSDLPEDAFRNEKNKFVISVFESVFVAVCEKIKQEGLNERKIEKGSLDTLKADKKFNEVSQGSTASTASVTTRLQRARELIILR